MSHKIVELKVEGMNCNNCAMSLNRYLERQGFKDVYVNFQTSEVRYDANESAVHLEQIKKGIQSMGFQVVEEDAPPMKKRWSLERKLWVSAMLTLPLFLNHFLMMAGIHVPALETPWVQFLFCLPVYAIGFFHFGKSAWGSLKGGIPNMDVLIFVGSTAAFVYSLIGLMLEQADYIFFETAATIITLVLLGNLMEKRAVDQTTTAIDELGRMQASKAKILMPSGVLVELPFEQLSVGDKLQVNEGDSIPIDGTLIVGEAWVDESMLTGESEPVLKQIGSTLIGASVVTQGHLQMQVSAIGKDTVLNQMIELVKTAQQNKPAIQRLADRISAIFVPVVLGIALLTFLLSYGFFGVTASEALMRAIAVLVISCPCAMGLATPTAVMVGVGRMARNGILVKGGDTLERITRIRKVVFDKTGTLTTGQFQLKNITYYDRDEPRINALIYTLEQHSSHPIAATLLKEMAHRRRDARIQLKNIKENRGEGLYAEDEEGHVYRLGSKRILKPSAATYNAQVFLTQNGQLLAALELSDEIKKEAGQAIDFLKKEGIEPILLSGDTEGKTKSTAAALSIDRYFAEALPAQKLEKLEALAREGHVAMVGDGINDAAALSKADIGIALSNGSAAAIQSAQLVLLNGRLDRLETAFSIGRHTVLTIRQNLFWAFAYNIVAIPVAALGFLNPMWGALFMAFSDVIVIGNSIRLKYKRLKH
ncbi:MAG TPA: cation-translocating P-type ATPase [Saprospiraceae bacterium]|nr:cation-translocating P-type ATPase [Saprospiraceae bacterium]HMQ85333.1 cation-translocating P-type ATPase [Saprospiraceae bacterium]